jgi:hypothetical protein
VQKGIKDNLGSTVAINDGPAAKDRGIPRKEENTIPLKHYNDLLDQYAALEKRLQEMN